MLMIRDGLGLKNRPGPTQRSTTQLQLMPCYNSLYVHKLASSIMLLIMISLLCTVYILGHPQTSVIKWKGVVPQTKRLQSLDKTASWLRLKDFRSQENNVRCQVLVQLGISLNGLRLKGISQKVIGRNGLRLKGIRQKVIGRNGLRLKGIRQKVIGLNGLRWSVTCRAALPRPCDVTRTRFRRRWAAYLLLPSSTVAHHFACSEPRACDVTWGGAARHVTLHLSPFRPMTFCLMPFNLSPFRPMTFCLMPFNLSPFRPITFWLMPFNLSPFRLMPNCTRPDTWPCFSWDLKSFSLSHDAVLSSDWSLLVWGTTPFHFMTEVLRMS